MREINIAHVLVGKRKEKGITQDDLAHFIGVSKASVSKWETGQSYPDVTLLPQLAAYFNISIDELMDYKPQMVKADIRKLYLQLAADFSSEPFDEVMNRCRGIIKKYFSCFPLLYQMGVLLFNHSGLAGSPEKTLSVIKEALDLFLRVKLESDDLGLEKQALFMEALSHIRLGEPQIALELLEGTPAPAMPPEVLLASAYQMTGKLEEAKSVYQIGMYQNIVVLFNFFIPYLALCADEADKHDEILRRALLVAEAFNLKQLHPAVLCPIYITAAQTYTSQGKRDQALDMLESYTKVVTGDIYPLQLHGDEFFDLLDKWLDDIDLGNSLPRDERIIRQSMAAAVADNPHFAILAGEPQFQQILNRLKSNR